MQTYIRVSLRSYQIGILAEALKNGVPRSVHPGKFGRSEVHHRFAPLRFSSVRPFNITDVVFYRQTERMSNYMNQQAVMGSVQIAAQRVAIWQTAVELAHTVEIFFTLFYMNSERPANKSQVEISAFGSSEKDNTKSSRCAFQN